MYICVQGFCAGGEDVRVARVRAYIRARCRQGLIYECEVGGRVDWIARRERRIAFCKLLLVALSQMCNVRRKRVIVDGYIFIMKM